MGNVTAAPEKNFCISAFICVDDINFPVQALVDSGAVQNLISLNIVQQLKLSTAPLNQLINIASLTGQTISSVSHKTGDLHLVLSGNHHER